MAAPSKIELVVEVNTSQATASIKGVNSSLSGMEQAAAQAGRGASRGIDGMTSSMTEAVTAGNLFADTIQHALGTIKDFITGSIMMAAENEKAGAAMRALANAHGVGAGVAMDHLAAIEALGFEFTEAAHAVKRFMIADMDLAQAEGLARLAKDAAAVQNVTAGAALESMVMAIEGGAARGLRTLGLFVDFQKDAELAQLRLGRALTASEERQIRYNVVMREGEKIHGAHAAAVETVEGQIVELRREYNNLREDIGAVFQEDFRAVIGHMREMLGWVSENAEALKKFGEIALWTAGALAAHALGAKILELARSLAALKLASINPYALLAVGVVGAGAAIYGQYRGTRDQLAARAQGDATRALPGVEMLGPGGDGGRFTAGEALAAIRRATGADGDARAARTQAVTQAKAEVSELERRMADALAAVMRTRDELQAMARDEIAMVATRIEAESRLHGQRLENNIAMVERNLDHSAQLLRQEESRAVLSRDAQLRALELTDAQTIEQKTAVEERKAAIEIEHITRVHEIRMRLFDLESSRMLIEEEATLNRLGYRASEIEARLAEVTAQRDAIRGFEQESMRAAVEGARESAAVRQARLVQDHNRRIFDTFQRQAEGVFDALLIRSQSAWAAIGNSLRMALLTAIKEVVTSRIAAALMQMFTGLRIPVGRMGGFMPGGGGIGAMGGMGALGAIAPMVGGPGGTGGFAGPFGTFGGPAGMIGAGMTGWRDLFGFGGGVQYAPGAAVTWQAATMGQKLMALGRSPAALMAGAALGGMGLYRGGLSGLGMTAAGGALLGFRFGGGVGAAIGAGVGALAGLVRMFVRGAQEQARDKIRATYNVDISDNNTLRQIVEIARQAFGGNLDMAIRGPQVRELIELYALSTGQNIGGLPRAMRPTALMQRSGGLFQQPLGGSAFDAIGAGTPSMAAPTVINITVPGAREFFEQETVRVVVDNPRAVQSAAMSATRQNAGRREMTGLQLSPGLVMS